MRKVRLRSGREVIIRPIGPGDGPRLKAAHERLSEQSRYARFLSPKPHLSAAETRYLVNVDGRDHVALVATPSEDPDRILGVARFVRLPEDPLTAELAVVVGDSFQHEGLATELLGRLALAAEGCGILRFRATMLATNLAAHGLIRGVAGPAATERHEGSVREVEFELAS